MTDGDYADAGHDRTTAPLWPSPCQRARRLAYDLVRELSIYQLAAERLRWTAPECAYRLEVALMDVRRQVADIEVYLQVRTVALARMQLPAFDRLVRRARRRRRRWPVQDYEAVRGRLSPGGRYHETVFPGEAAQALDDDEPDVRDEEIKARLGRAIHTAVASAGAVHPARLGRFVRDVIDRHVTVSDAKSPLAAPAGGRRLAGPPSPTPMPRHRRSFTTMATDTNGSSEAADAEQLMAHLTATAEFEALRQVGNDLAGVLFSRQQAATEPDAVDALNTERRAVQARLLAITPGSDEVTTTLETWAARLRALRDQ